MNKRQAKKGRSHGSYRKIKKAWFGGNPITIPRHRQRLKWIKRQWAFERSVKECGADE